MTTDYMYQDMADAAVEAFREVSVNDAVDAVSSAVASVAGIASETGNNNLPGGTGHTDVASGGADSSSSSSDDSRTESQGKTWTEVKGDVASVVANIRAGASRVSSFFSRKANEPVVHADAPTQKAAEAALIKAAGTIPADLLPGKGAGLVIAGALARGLTAGSEEGEGATSKGGTTHAASGEVIASGAGAMAAHLYPGKGLPPAVATVVATAALTAAGPYETFSVHESPFGEMVANDPARQYAAVEGKPISPETLKAGGFAALDVAATAACFAFIPLAAFALGGSVVVHGLAAEEKLQIKQGLHEGDGSALIRPIGHLTTMHEVAPITGAAGTTGLLNPVIATLATRPQVRAALAVGSTVVTPMLMAYRTAVVDQTRLADAMPADVRPTGADSPTGEPGSPFAPAV